MSEKILIVDDEPKVLTALQRSLGHRFSLCCATSGAEALALLESHGPFAAVVSDMRMPGMNGLELLREMRRRTPETVRMILSGHADFDVAVAAINEGAVFRFHTKPVSSEVLEASIENALIHHCKEKQGAGLADPSAELLRESEEIREALRSDQFRLFLQPQGRLADGGIVGVEALVRWVHPQRGLLLPGQFFGAAEAAGLLPEITHWMLNAACAEIRRWQERKQPPLHMAVNITTIDLSDKAFPDYVKNFLERHGVGSHSLELELTESAAIADVSGARDILGRLASLGIKLSIDDFGVGYSSLGWLRQLPVNKLKIDRMFIADIANDCDAYNLLGSIVAMANNLRLTALAEGVETERQMTLVAQTGCALVQGFHLARPMPAEQFIEWLATRSQ